MCYFISNFFLFALITYSIACAVLIGNSWDLEHHLLLGKSTFNYLFSFGLLNENITYREYYSSLYWTIVYFFSQFFPKNFEYEIFRLVNLFVGWLALFGFYKFGKILFNKDVGIIFFITLFFYPIFFGHMAINPKDTILAFCHIWIFYFVILYLKKQNNNFNSIKIISKVSFLLALGMGIQLYFLASLFFIFVFIFLEIFFFHKIINKDFSLAKFIKDFFYILFIFYFILILFWIDTHGNIIIKPFELFLESFSTSRGWPVNLINGELFYSSNAPKNYLLVSFINKSPEYIIILYVFFILFYLKIKNFSQDKFDNFNYKISYILLTLAFPTIIMFINPFPVYDGLRLFMWAIPYSMIIPSIVIYYFINNLNKYYNKLFFSLISVFFLYYIFIFFSYSPFQYAYLNLLSGQAANKNNLFVNDYWGTTLKALVIKIKKNEILQKEENIKLYLCGVPSKIVKRELIKNSVNNIQIWYDGSTADYIMLTNRLIISKNNNGKNEIIKCLDLVNEELVSIKRLGHTLSIFGKKIN